MRNWIKKSILLAVLLLVGLFTQMTQVSASEIDQMPDLESGRKGTLSITLFYKDSDNQKTNIQGATLSLLKVADLSVVDGGTTLYTLTSDFAESEVDFDGMTASESKQAAQVLKHIAETKQLIASSRAEVTDDSGCVSFEDLEPAMYLVMQTGHASAIPAYTEMEAYLVSVPMGENENDQAFWNYTVDSVPKMELESKPTLGSIQVTKRVGIYRGNQIALIDAIDEVFYFGIFEDAQGTIRYENYPIQKARLQNASVGTAEFRNLPEGTYYIFETDKDGNVIPPNTRIEDSVPPYTCIIEGKETNAVVIDPDHGVLKGEITFNNVYDDLPWGYGIQGQITIKKNVQKDGKPVKVDDTFYAGIFTKEGDDLVLYHVVELKQNGSVTIPVVFEKSEIAPTTYWIYETDREGNLIDKSSFGYKVSGEKSVVLTLEELEQSVELTNEVKANNGSSNSSQVKTGDDTSIAPYLILAGAALLVVIALVVSRRKVR